MSPKPENGGPYPHVEHTRDVPHANDFSLPTSDQLVAQAKNLWQIETLPPPPSELLQTLERARKEGFFGFMPIYYRDLKFTKDSEFPGKGIKPAPWLWRNIEEEILFKNKGYQDKLWKGFAEKNPSEDASHARSVWEGFVRWHDGIGDIDEDVVHLHEMWALYDSTQNPNHEEDGKQMYKNDARLGSILRGLREAGKIEKIATIPSYEYKKREIPLDSRFGLSWNEITNIVISEVAAVLNLDPSRVRLPRAIEYNITGNLYLPELGTTDTSVYMADRQHGRPFLGGNSVGTIIYFRAIPYTSGLDLDGLPVDRLLLNDDAGVGLANIGCTEKDYHESDVGFGFLIAFPIK